MSSLALFERQYVRVYKVFVCVALFVWDISFIGHTLYSLSMVSKKTTSLALFQRQYVRVYKQFVSVVLFVSDLSFIEPNLSKHGV